jgi:tetratricopeptide (TPR) repeat protein
MPPLKPLLFVAMPFGKKTSPDGHEIDFNRVYLEAIEPAAEAAGLEVIRADKERSGGIIHVPMFERLLLSEVVIADLTIPNPNVFYELGVRHAARPRTTVLIFGQEAGGNQLPFDVYMLRALPYALKDGELTDEAASDLRAGLEQKLRDAINDLEAKDSPLFQLISKFPGISLPHDVTESFRDRARQIDRIRDRLSEARILKGDEGREAVRAIEDSLGDVRQIPTEVLIDLLLSYRDVKAWDEMIRLYENIPEGPVARAVTVREQYAFALNRRNSAGDRERAVRVLEEIINKEGVSPETCGILGRVYKDMAQDAESQNDQRRASSCLDAAINWYRRGFEADPRDYYPGINAATLLFKKGDAESLDELKRIVPAVVFAVARRGGINSRDYWDVATVLEAAVLGEDWQHAGRAANKLLASSAPPWNFETTVNNLRIIRATRASRGLTNAELDEIIETLGRGGK